MIHWEGERRLYLVNTPGETMRSEEFLISLICGGRAFEGVGRWWRRV